MDPNTGPSKQPQPSAAPQTPGTIGTAGPHSPGPHSQRIVIQPAGGWLSRIFGAIGWLGLLICLGVILAMYSSYEKYFQPAIGIQERYHSLAKEAEEKVAIITIDGIIMEADGFVKRQIDRVRQDDKVKAVVVRVDSPGGSVAASDYLYHHLKKLKQEKNIPLVVSMGGLAASGGYYVAMAVGDEEKSIFSEPTTLTGSIGVIIPHYDLSGLLARYDVKDDSISSHPRKQMLSMTKKMSPEDREIIQRHINELFERFKDVVKEGRPAFRKDEAALDELATGEIFTANRAKEHGLVDEIGFIEDAIGRAIELAGLDKKTTRVVRYRHNPSVLDQLTGGSQGNAHTFQLSTLLEMTAPRAFYLSTWMPPVLSSPQP